MGLIRRGKTYFAKTNTTIILPGDTPQARATHFWRQNKSLQLQMTFIIWNGFLNFKSLFVNIQCRFQWGKLPGFISFPVLNIHWPQDNTFSLLYESWLVNSNFRRTSRMHGNLGQATIDAESCSITVPWVDSRNFMV